MRAVSLRGMIKPRWVLLTLVLGSWGVAREPAPPDSAPTNPRAADAAPADAIPAEQIEFFEKQIRPVLVEHCYECHAGEKAKGGLRLDTQSGWRDGGDSGPAIVAGEVDGSLLIQSVRYGGDFEMPPKGKLPDELIRRLEEWVRRGAPDPRSDEAAIRRAGVDWDRAREHWAYRPLGEVSLPRVKEPGWFSSPVDAFILAKLEEVALRPAVDADRPVLARRVYFDLTGLPPTPEELAAFVADPAPDAYERLVETLLASPHFGERWGRIWLDVARFAESTTLRGLVFPEAWRYRDYVIASWNEDRPFDRFVREQIAGDLLPAASDEDRARQIVATSYLALGNTNLEEQDKVQLDMDVVDEQLDVLGKGLLAQTLTCARCHDHKFDPVPQRDYYALAGILRNVQALEHSNVSKWVEVPLPVPAEQAERLRAHDETVARLEERIAVLKRAVGPKKPDLAEGVLSPAELPGIVVDDRQAKKVGEWQESQFVKRYIGEGYLHDMNAASGQKSLTFVPELPRDGVYEVRFAYTANANRARAVPVTIFSAEGEKTVLVDQVVPPPVDGRFVSLGSYRFEKAGQSFVLISNDDSSGHVVADAVQFLPADSQPTPVAAAKPGDPKTGDPKPGDPSPGVKVESAEAEAQAAELVSLEKELKRVRAEAPHRPMAMGVRERSPIGNAQINIRGVARNLGEEVPRGFLRICSLPTEPEMPADQSGRVQLAEWLSSPLNPLPSRVLANRLWQALFGAGIVRSVDNFGLTGDSPTHPELLEYLAGRLARDGWSVKDLVRELVLSRTYRQSSVVAESDRRRGEELDRENRWLWRMNRRRLPAEMIRDAMLSVSGALSLRMGGASFPSTLAADYGFEQKGTRRSIYEPVFRNSLPEFFEAFDFADPSLVTGKRGTSTVAPQALYLLNHSFVWEQAQRAAERVLREVGPDDAARVRVLFEMTLGRPPSATEAVSALQYVAHVPTGSDNATGSGQRPGQPSGQRWTQFCQSLFAAIDFRYVE